MFSLWKRRPQRRRNVRGTSPLAAEALEHRELKTGLVPLMGIAGQVPSQTNSASGEERNAGRVATRESGPEDSFSPGLGGGTTENPDQSSPFGTPHFLADPTEMGFSLGDEYVGYVLSSDEISATSTQDNQDFEINAIALENFLDFILPPELQLQVESAGRASQSTTTTEPDSPVTRDYWNPR